MDVTVLVFWFFAVWTIGSALLCVSRRNPIASALWLVSAMFSLAAIFVLLNAEFIAAIQVIVYAGAVMVLFLFVIMLLNLESSQRKFRRWWLLLPATGLALVMALQLLPLGGYSVNRMASEFSSIPAPDPALVFPEGDLARRAVQERGVVGAVAEPLFRGYLIPFEITSVLLLVAVVGAVILAKKKL